MMRKLRRTKLENGQTRDAKIMMTPVVLAGGSGSRLWPVSRKLYPKQLQRLIGDYTMLQNTLLRLSGVEGVGAPIVLCNDEHRFLVESQMQEIMPIAGSEILASDAKIVLEKTARNTAPAVVTAAILCDDPDSILLVMPADHVVRDIEKFQVAVRTGLAAASAGNIVTFGIAPTSAHTGFGYIRLADIELDQPGVNLVREFVEKPDLETAEKYLASGEYFWNSGIFMFKSSVFLSEIERFAPDVLSSVTAAVKDVRIDLGFLALGEAFALAPSISVDYAVMEKTDLAAVMPVDFGWSDVGSWQGLWEASDRDSDNNLLEGQVFAKDVSGSIVRSTHRTVAVLGLDDVVIVDSADALLVTDRKNSERVKEVVDHFEEFDAELARVHKKVYRPWGSYESLGVDDLFQVKRLTLKCGARISLQRHQHRAEHWVVVSGTARVIRGEEELVLNKNESTYIPVGTRHMLENIGAEALEIIEVQTGSYFGEDDIERFEDVYGRIKSS